MNAPANTSNVLQFPAQARRAPPDNRYTGGLSENVVLLKVWAPTRPELPAATPETAVICALIQALARGKSKRARKLRRDIFDTLWAARGGRPSPRIESAMALVDAAIAGMV